MANGIAHAIHGVRQQRGRVAFEFQNRPAGGLDDVVGRLRRIDQQKHGKIAPAPLEPGIDVRARRQSGAQVDRGRDRCFEIEPVALALAAHAQRAANFGRVDQRRDAIGGFRISFENVVDLLSAAIGGIVFEHRRPVAALATDQIVPFRIARDRNADFGLLRHKPRDVGRSTTARLAFAIRRL